MNVLNLVYLSEQERYEAVLAILTLNQHNAPLLQRAADTLHLNLEGSTPSWQVIWENCQQPDQCQAVVRTFGVFSQEDLATQLNLYQKFIAVEQQKKSGEEDEKESSAALDLDSDLDFNLLAL